MPHNLVHNGLVPGFPGELEGRPSFDFVRQQGLDQDHRQHLEKRSGHVEMSSLACCEKPGMPYIEFCIENNGELLVREFLR